MLSSKVAQATASIMALSCVVVLVYLRGFQQQLSGAGQRQELMGTWTVPHGIGIDQEPYSAPINLYLYWGSTVNKRFTGSGEHVRHIFKIGSIQGGEYRDPKFIQGLDSGVFNAMSQKCCVSLLFPPMEWDFPVVNPMKIEAQNIRAFVANGNSMMLTGGLLDAEFINRYFFYNLEPADGNYSPGPFRVLPKLMGLSREQNQMILKAPRALPQKGISVTAIKKESLPSGATVIYGTPRNAAVFSIKFCMADNPANDEATTLPPVKVLPRDCPVTAAQGRPCSCGFICYMGYNWNDRYPSRWDKALKIVERICSQVPPENNDPALIKKLKLPKNKPYKYVVMPKKKKASTRKAQERHRKRRAERKVRKVAGGKADKKKIVPRKTKERSSKKGCSDTKLCSEDWSREQGCGPLCRLKRLVKKLKNGM